MDNQDIAIELAGDVAESITKVIYGEDIFEDDEGEALLKEEYSDTFNIIYNDIINAIEHKDLQDISIIYSESDHSFQQYATDLGSKSVEIPPGTAIGVYYKDGEKSYEYICSKLYFLFRKENIK